MPREMRVRAEVSVYVIEWGVPAARNGAQGTSSMYGHNGSRHRARRVVPRLWRGGAHGYRCGSADLPGRRRDGRGARVVAGDHPGGTTGVRHGGDVVVARAPGDAAGEVDGGAV